MIFLESFFEDFLRIIGYYPIAFIKWALGGFKKPYKSYLDWDSTGYEMLRLLIVLLIIFAAISMIT